MALANRTKRFRPRYRSDHGVQSVRCRVCRDRLRVISGRHLSKHEIDRETYMEEYGLTPDELIAKDFRVIQNTWRSKKAGRTARFSPHGRREWIAAIKKVYNRDRNVTTKQLQTKSPHLYYQGVWIFGDWDNALHAAGFDPERTRIHRVWDEEALLKGIRRLRGRRLPLYARYAMKNHSGLFHKAIQHYESWDKALVAAGVVEKAVSGWLHSSPLAVLRALRDFLERRPKEEVKQSVKSQ